MDKTDFIVEYNGKTYKYFFDRKGNVWYYDSKGNPTSAMTEGGVTTIEKAKEVALDSLKGHGL